MALTVSVLQGGTNSHATTSEEVNHLATDFVSEGVVGAITNTAGVAPATGAFAVNAQGTPDMTVAVSAGVCYVTATPTSGNSQLLRVKNSASANVTISANSTGGTRYDWVYVKIDPDKAKDPAVDASDVATLVTSRSTSNTTDNGTPPTYGTLLAVVTVANGASSITNGNIADSRVVTGTNPIFEGCCTTKVTSNQSLSDATFTAITFNNDLYDTSTYHDTSSNTSRITVPAAGKYRFTATIAFAANATGSRLVTFRVNGTSTDRLGYSGTSNWGASLATQVTATTTLNLAANDYVEVFAFQNSTGSLNVTAETNNNGTCRFMCEKIGL